MLTQRQIETLEILGDFYTTFGTATVYAESDTPSYDSAIAASGRVKFGEDWSPGLYHRINNDQYTLPGLYPILGALRSQGLIERRPFSSTGNVIRQVQFGCWILTDLGCQMLGIEPQPPSTGPIMWG